MRILCLQHSENVTPGTITEWVKQRGHTLHIVRVWEGEPLPPLAAADWLLILGGPMGVYEEEKHPWLAHEKRYIKEAIAQGKPIFGICLGSQLLAEALGGRVYKHQHQEIGWHSVPLTEAGREHPVFSGLPPAPEFFQWHGDTFDLPEGASLLASNAATRNQAFAYGDRIVAVQFHPEIRMQEAEAWIAEAKPEIFASPYAQQPEHLLVDTQKFHTTEAWMYRLLDNWQHSVLRENELVP